MKQAYPPRALTVPEKPAKRWIWIVSSIILLAVVVLNRVQVPAPDGLDVHVFARINAVIEELVRFAPDEYLWIHRRFKRRPEGEPKVY